MYQPSPEMRTISGVIGNVPNSALLNSTNATCAVVEAPTLEKTMVSHLWQVTPMKIMKLD